MAENTLWLEKWYEALHSPHGTILAVSDVRAAIQKLYQARAKSGDPDLQGLSIKVSPVKPNEEVWLVKQKKDNPSGTEGTGGP